VAAKTFSNPNTKPIPRLRGRRSLAYAVVAILLIALIACVWITISILRPSQPRTHRLLLATDVVPLRVHLAEQIRAEGGRHHLDIELSSKQYGALDSLNLVDSPNDFKLALVPGGITAREYPNVRMVTTLTSEPLHVFVRSELGGKEISALRGKRVNLGPATTASHHLAREVLAFAGLTPSAATGYTIETTPPDELYRELGRMELLAGPERARALEKLPDGVVFLAPLHSMLGRRLATIAGYQLLSLPFAEAFCVDRLNPPNGEGVRVNRTVLTRGDIPPYTYGSEPAVPARGCTTIQVPLLLVAQADTDPEAVVRLLETIYDSPMTSAIRPPPLRDQVHPFPLHPGTEQYLHRNDPVVTPQLAETFGKVAGGIGAFASGLLALYTFLRLRKLNRFEAYYREIGSIELIARGLEMDPDAPTAPDALRTHLEARLSDLKCRVLADFAEGGLKGEGLVAGIIALINDTRESLARTLPQGIEGTPTSEINK